MAQKPVQAVLYLKHRLIHPSSPRAYGIVKWESQFRMAFTNRWLRVLRRKNDPSTVDSHNIFLLAYTIMPHYDAMQCVYYFPNWNEVIDKFASTYSINPDILTHVTEQQQEILNRLALQHGSTDAEIYDKLKHLRSSNSSLFGGHCILENSEYDTDWKYFNLPTKERFKQYDLRVLFRWIVTDLPSCVKRTTNSMPVNRWISTLPQKQFHPYACLLNARGGFSSSFNLREDKQYAITYFKLLRLFAEFIRDNPDILEKEKYLL